MMNKEEKETLDEIFKKLEHLLDVTIAGNVGLSFNRKSARILVKHLKGSTNE